MMEFDPENKMGEIAEETQAEAMIRTEYGTGPLQDPGELTGKNGPEVYNASHDHALHSSADEVQS